MKTPYDAALRVAERALDEVRAEIGEALARLHAIEAATAALDATLLSEKEALAADRQLPAEPFFARARGQRDQLAQAMHEAEAVVSALRRRVVECYGTRTAIADAASRYRAEAERTIAAAEQAALDDMAAARLIRRRRRPATLPAAI